MNPVPDALMDAESGVRVGRVVNWNTREGKSKVIFTVTIEKGRVRAEWSPGGAAITKSRDGVVGFIYRRAGEDGVSCVFEGWG